MSAINANYGLDETINDWATHLALDNDLLETAGKLGARTECVLEVFTKIFPPLELLRTYSRVTRSAAFIEGATASIRSIAEIHETKSEENHYKKKSISMGVFNGFFNCNALAWNVASIACAANPIAIAGSYFAGAVSAMGETVEAIKKARHSRHKSDPVHLLEDRLSKYDKITQALESIGSSNRELQDHLLGEQKRLGFQARALANHVEGHCYVSLELQMRFQSHPCYQARGEPSAIQTNLVDYLVQKQKRMANMHAKVAVGKSITALGLVALGASAVAALAFPPIAAGLAIAGLATLAVSTAVNFFTTPSQGFSIMGFKSQARKRYETVFSYMATSLTEDGKHPQITETMTALKKEKEALSKDPGKSSSDLAQLRNKLHQQVEDVLVRRHLGLSQGDDVNEVVSKNDRKRIVGLECKKLLKTAKEFLSERSQAKHRTEVAEKVAQPIAPPKAGISNADTLFTDSYMLSHIPESETPHMSHEGTPIGTSMREETDGESEGM